MTKGEALAALEAATQAYCDATNAEYGGESAPVSGWVLVAADYGSSSSVTLAGPDGQPAYATAGLLAAGKAVHDASWELTPKPGA